VPFLSASEDAHACGSVVLPTLRSPDSDDTRESVAPPPTNLEEPGATSFLTFVTVYQFIVEIAMRRRLLAAVGAILANAGMAWSQGAFDPVPSRIEPAAAVDSARIWGSSEYLLWWVRDAHTPLVTTGDPALAAAAGTVIGTLGTPGTRPLNSGSQDYGAIPGGRLTFGSWLDCENSVGFEASGFLMGTRSSTFAVRSDAAGSPAISIPAIAATVSPPVESAQPYAIPGAAAGAVTFTTRLDIWGTEANGVFALRDSGPIRAKLLAGFRYIDVTESLDMTDSTSFIGSPVPLAFVMHDNFQTRNQIYAGQIGAQVEATYGCFFVNVIGKAAIGLDHETVNIEGDTRIVTPSPFPFAPPILPVNAGGFFAQKTNSGRQSHDEFVFVPELRIQAGVNLGEHVRVFAGYEILYLSNVARPGDQIDRTINGTQGFGSPLVGAARPAPLFSHSDMWMQGVSAGLEIRF
jgi:hypothetical protein